MARQNQAVGAAAGAGDQVELPGWPAIGRCSTWNRASRTTRRVIDDLGVGLVPFRADAADRRRADQVAHHFDQGWGAVACAKREPTVWASVGLLVPSTHGISPLGPSAGLRIHAASLRGAMGVEFRRRNPLYQAGGWPSTPVWRELKRNMAPRRIVISVRGNLIHGPGACRRCPGRLPGRSGQGVD